VSDPLLEVADELYGLGLGDFTPARDARAKELKKADPDLSGRVKRLRKPSLAAWTVNLLVRRESDQVGQVLGVGAALREAAASLAGDELRALTRQRRQLTAAVTTRARAVAAESGQRLTDAVTDQVEATLTAAILDERCAQAVRSGLLVAALAATGVDEVDLGAAVAVPEALGFTATRQETAPAPRPELHVVPDPDADAKALAAAREELEAAEGELAEATETLDEATSRVHDLEARSLQVQGELDELRRRLAELESQAEEVDEELEEAEGERAEAEEVVLDARHARDAAAEAVTRLQGEG
jgi:DNA repair exonuclease SbcCD ATPase subunit